MILPPSAAEGGTARSWRRASSVACIAVLILACGLVALRLVLPWFGSALVVSDPLVRADAIVVLASRSVDRIYEGVTLYREGYAPRIVVSHPDDRYERDLQRRLGVHLPISHELHLLALRQMGVPEAAIEDLPGSPATTEQEAFLSAVVMTQRHYRRLIVATSPYHTRRARLYFRHAAHARFEVIVRPSRFERIAPQRWWRSPADRIDVFLEWVKMPKYVWSLVRSRH